MLNCLVRKGKGIENECFGVYSWRRLNLENEKVREGGWEEGIEAGQVENWPMRIFQL